MGVDRMSFLRMFQQLPVVEILTVALLIILTVYLIRKSIKLFFDKTSILDENGVPVESFKFNQITELNVDFRGHQYSLSDLVKEADFVEASKKVRYELAMAAYKNDLMMAESGESEAKKAYSL